MPIYLLDTFGSASIGVYIRATEEFIIVPKQVPSTKVEKLQEWFKTKIVKTNIGGSVLIGSLICANSNGMILPRFVWDEELEALKSLRDVNITVMDTKRTAYGNLVLTNDYGAVVDPRLSRKDVKVISDTLGVEAVPGEVAGLPYVGALTTATNKGAMAHPLIKPEEEELLRDVLKVHVGIGTVNCGIPYIATGLIGNSKVAAAGSLTTGPELFMIGQALGVAEEDE
ncbi:translation initiation factor IF-6 [Candidatus Bathyarchaeota archaeon]|nr:translation initiation factor IF-6 [Candidatus Bathyarchaeota archaeon]RJS88090.1 MAG: translation initiation factor IF-6 [Candidatus Bathyarchaeota archaeon]